MRRWAVAVGGRLRPATRQRRRIAVIAALLLLSGTFVPVFQANVLAPGDTYFFSNFDRESQALVLAEIERDRSGAEVSRWGLQNARPAVLSPYDTFDGLQFGQRPSATGYVPYPSSLGLQGRFFDLLWGAGCRTLNCMTTVESALFSLVFVLFAFLVGYVTRRSFAIVLLATGVLSPWVVSAAHNLYWVPWTWLLPAAAACAAILARSRRGRAIALACVAVATAVKASTGYEFLSTTTLLAASIPILATVLGRRRKWRAVLRDAAAVFAACVAGFLVVLVIHALVSGSGSITLGLQHIAHDAMKRTYGSAALGADAVTIESLRVSPLRVLAIYLVDWRSSVFSLGVGGPFTTLALGPGAFWVMVVSAAAITVVGALRNVGPWRRNAILLSVSAAPAVSWYVLAKSHSYTATSVNYVLWYLVFIPIVVWVIGEAVLDGALAGRIRAVARLVAESAGSPRVGAPTTASEVGGRDRDRAPVLSR